MPHSSRMCFCRKNPSKILKCPAKILWSLLFGWGAAVCLPQPVLSQPPAAVPSEERFVPEIEEAWRALRAQVGAQEFEQPQAAIARYQEFYEQHGYRSATTGVTIAATIAQLYWKLLDNPAKALEIYDWALVKYDYLPQSKHLQKQRDEIAAVGAFPATGTAAPIILAPDSKRSAVKSALPVPGKPAALTPDKPAENTPNKNVTIASGKPTIPVVVAPADKPAEKFGVPKFGATKFSVTRFGITPPSPSRLAISPRLTALAAYLEQWRSGRLSWEQFVQESQLTSADALALLASPELVSGLRRDKELRSQLTEIMQRDTALIAVPTKLPPSVQYALGVYDSAQGNARAELLFRNLLQMELPEDRHPRKVSVLERLAEYYAGKGELQRAAETALETEKHTARAIWIGNMQITAARYYLQAGQEAKAQELYKQAQHSSAGWSKGLAIYDQASALIAENKHEEARKLLSTPITGQNAGHIKAALWSLLARSYFATDEWAEAEHYAKQAIELSESMELLKREGLEAQIESAHLVLQRIEERKAQGIVIVPNRVLWMVRSSERPMRQWLKVQSTTDVPLQITTTDERIAIEVMPEVHQRGELFEREVALKLKDATQSFTATLKVHGTQQPDAPLQVSVAVEVAP